MTSPATTAAPEITVIGGDEPTDELLRAWAELLLQIVDAETQQKNAADGTA
jgi:hypothetical protein